MIFLVHSQYYQFLLFCILLLLLLLLYYIILYYIYFFSLSFISHLSSLSYTFPNNPTYSLSLTHTPTYKDPSLLSLPISLIFYFLFSFSFFFPFFGGQPPFFPSPFLFLPLSPTLHGHFQHTPIGPIFIFCFLLPHTATRPPHFLPFHFFFLFHFIFFISQKPINPSLLPA